MIDRSGLTAAEVLHELDHACHQQRLAHNEKLIMATVWADRHPAESIDPYQLSISGGDQPIRLGGDGTPAMARFATAEFAAHLHTSRKSGELLIADALDLCFRFRRIWARICASEIDGFDTRFIARETRHLSLAQCDEIDDRLVDRIGTVSFGRLAKDLQAAIIEVDAKNIAAMADEVARTGVFLGKARNGYRSVEVRTDALQAIWFYARTCQLAAIMKDDYGDQRPFNQRHAATLEVMHDPVRHIEMLARASNPSLFDPDPNELDNIDVTDSESVGIDDDQVEPETTPTPEVEPEPNPDPAAEPDSESTPEATPNPDTGENSFFRRSPIEYDRNLARQAIEAINQLDPDVLRPQATLYVHVAAETLQTGLGVTRVEDIGPVISTLVAGWLGECNLTVKPVIDLNAEQMPVDCYEIPRKMRERMFLKQPCSIFPYSAGGSRRNDLDHTDPYRDGELGQTREDNLGPLTRPEHNLVTHGGWQRRQPEPGTYLVRAPHGRVFLVNRYGTSDLGDDQLAALIWHATTPTD